MTALVVAKKKVEVLEALRDHFTMENAARAVGIDRRHLYNWRQEDPEFAAECDAAREAALDRLEAKGYEVALNADGRYYEKDSLLNRFFILKGHRPHYKDAYRPEVAVREVHFTFEVPMPPGLKERQASLPEHVIEGEVVGGGSEGAA